ncbi:peptidoglycan-binding protein [Roseovarius sp. Pro17]|uniref:peptidoglycan-binding protein n=1 Tax=Roseovarius sp. Pro17 TaxID=3108175 RepID=UPI002D77CDCD|nr:peptidoglycan-binding protein [Roseovarius sp. Pro17]
MGYEQYEQELLVLRRSLEAPFAKAQAAGDSAEMQRLEDIAGEIDDLRIDLGLHTLGELAFNLARIREKIDGHKVNLDSLANGPLSAIKKAIEDIFAQTAEESIATPLVADTNVDSSVKAQSPVLEPSGQLVLTEAHLIALWRRSLFPIDVGRITIFGLRGCRPVEFSGTGMGAQHEIVMTPVDYQVMKCCIGHWKPGDGLALFPGSTVPYGPIVMSKISNDGRGVNQIGRGRYSRYTAGWHKRSEGSSGHWALQQACAITIQRTGDDDDYDLTDRWHVGSIAGDNIHCAFHMGVDGNPADAKFSSAGCQVIAGTVKKGKLGSEVGPYKTFITPFADKLGRQKEAQYVLFDAEEAQMMIRTKCVGKTVLLRFGSYGPIVEEFQKALNRKNNAHLKVDGDFGPGTFNAVVDFQTRIFGPEADDGIVGADTAAELGMALPAFDFGNAVSGGSGHSGPSGALTGTGPTPSPIPPAAAAGESLAFGKITRNKHGQAFNDKVIGIASRIKCDPNHLMAVMAFETGESFSPSIENAAGSGAIGLIQFMPATATHLGTTSAKLAAMSAIDQLGIVEAYFKMQVNGRPMPALSDLYMAVLWPAAVGKLDSHVLFAKGTKAYAQNARLDINKNGKITKAEAASKVQDKLVLGMKENRFG